ncbi:hypothetical protein GCM10012278_51500 [Nonomuraea glycinis]|uniref:LPXTG cell wall anchor domain-containing protein n=1 Tax=Nonomuraea glycinis TaxID=2047744 RepID=A0A918ABC7_9ACTN|nr:hypothetical protein GCM10012278_51500 [Nonomuraea glycinis]
MLTSKVRHRLALKTSAVGMASTLVLLAGSAFALSAPASAAVAADKTMEVTYTCTGGAALTAGQVKATVSVQDSVEPGKRATVTWKFSALKAAKQLTTGQTTSSAGGDLTVSGGGTPTPLKGTGTGSVTTAVAQGGEFTPPNMTAVLTAPSAAGTVTLTPVTTATAAPLTIKVGEDTANCTYVSVAPTTGISVDVKVGGGTGSGTDIVDYECTGPGATGETQNVQIKVELTMPTSARANQQFEIGWKGTYVTGQELQAPTTGTLTPKIFAYTTMTGITGLTSATGEGTLGTITAGQTIPLPTTAVSLKSTATSTGTATVKPGKLNFGANTATGNQPMIECAVQNDTELKTYPLVVGTATSTPTSSNTPTGTPTGTPTPTKTKTEFVTETPTSEKTTERSSETPRKGADTGAGGDAGPDGRMFLLAGSVLIMGAGAGGLLLRRRSISKG